MDDDLRVSFPHFVALRCLKIVSMVKYAVRITSRRSRIIAKRSFNVMVRRVRVKSCAGQSRFKGGNKLMSGMCR